MHAIMLAVNASGICCMRRYEPDLYACLFFFFQAEDGIRDVAVTGVQTCALPICGAAAPAAARSRPAGSHRGASARETPPRLRRRAPAAASGPDRADRVRAARRADSLPSSPAEAGLPDLALGGAAILRRRGGHLVGGQREARAGRGGLGGLHDLELGI